VLNNLCVSGVDVNRMLDGLELLLFFALGLGVIRVHLVKSFQQILVIVAKFVQHPALSNCFFMFIQRILINSVCVCKRPTTDCNMTDKARTRVGTEKRHGYID